MLKNWIQSITAECEVIRFSENLNVYPIFKNGRSSLIIYAYRNNLPIMKNKEISKLIDITIYIRDPLKRFISGVHTFFYLNQLEINDINLKKIDNHEIVNRHFLPQSFWLLHLYKFYKGDIVLKDVKEAYDLVPLREGPWTGNPIEWFPLSAQLEDQIKTMDYKKFVDVDYNILNKHMNRKTKLSNVVKEIKDALS